MTVFDDPISRWAERIAPPETPPSWERLEGEPSKWYARFELYRLIGPNRNLLTTYKHDLARKRANAVVEENSRSPKSVPSIWRRYFERYQWRERAEEWDAYQVRQASIVEQELQRSRLADVAEQREHLKIEEREIADELIAKARLMLSWPLATERTMADEADAEGHTWIRVVEPARWTMRDAVRMVEAADKLRRLSLDMETSTVKVDIESEARRMARRNGWDEDETVRTMIDLAGEYGIKAS